MNGRLGGPGAVDRGHAPTAPAFWARHALDRWRREGGRFAPAAQPRVAHTEAATTGDSRRRRPLKART